MSPSPSLLAQQAERTRSTSVHRACVKFGTLLFYAYGATEESAYQNVDDQAWTAWRAGLFNLSDAHTCGPMRVSCQEYKP